MGFRCDLEGFEVMWRGLEVILWCLEVIWMGSGGDLKVNGGDLEGSGGDLDVSGGDLEGSGGDLDVSGGDLEGFGGDLERFGGDPKRAWTRFGRVMESGGLRMQLCSFMKGICDLRVTLSGDVIV